MNNVFQVQDETLKKIENSNSTKNLQKQNAQMAEITSISKVINKSEASPQNQNKKGFFSNLWDKIKSYWIIEEEDYIDAHGFPAKRPNKKIPLLNKKDALKKEVNYEGGNCLAYASMHSPFGRVFL